jgi:biopolymer transport protein ExbD
MPRVKVARKSTAIDMTPVCDVAFLLLTFFILTAKPRVDDPTKAEVPMSSKETLLPETNTATVTVGGTGKVFYSISGNDIRSEALGAMGEKYHETFTPEEKAKFAIVEVFGVPMAQMKNFLSLTPEERTKFQQPGIPADTTNNSELSNWILTSRQADKALHDKDLQMSIKGDRREEYPIINTVISIFEKQKIFKFSLITNLRAAPKK